MTESKLQGFLVIWKPFGDCYFCLRALGYSKSVFVCTVFNRAIPSVFAQSAVMLSVPLPALEMWRSEDSFLMAFELSNAYKNWKRLSSLSWRDSKEMSLHSEEFKSLNIWKHTFPLIRFIIFNFKWFLVPGRNGHAAILSLHWAAWQVNQLAVSQDSEMVAGICVELAKNCTVSVVISNCTCGALFAGVVWW